MGATKHAFGRTREMGVATIEATGAAGPLKRLRQRLRRMWAWLRGDALYGGDVERTGLPPGLFDVLCAPCRCGIACCECACWGAHQGSAALLSRGDVHSPPPGVPPKGVIMLLALTCKMMYEISEEGWRDSFAKDFKERADIAAQHVSEGEARAAGLLKRAMGAERAEVTDATSSGADVTNKFHGAVFIDPVMQDVSTRVFPEFTQAALAEEVTFIHTVKELRHKIDTNAMLTVNTAMRRVVVSFRGTASAQNVLSDAKVLKRGADDHSGTSGPAIHGGFAEAYYRGGVAVELESRLAELYRDRGDLFDQRLYITGHSLGGALAQLLAYRLVRHSMLPDEVKVYVVRFRCSQKWLDRLVRNQGLNDIPN